jgi:hypothetical protein
MRREGEEALTPTDVARYRRRRWIAFLAKEPLPCECADRDDYASCRRGEDPLHVTVSARRGCFAGTVLVGRLTMDDLRESIIPPGDNWAMDDQLPCPSSGANPVTDPLQLSSVGPSRVDAILDLLPAAASVCQVV